jgi:hypothetical protein
VNTKDYIKEFEKRVKAVEDPAFMFDIVSSTHAKQVHRIHTEGKNGNGVAIGSYENEPYKKKRRKKGLPTSTVILKFTNQLQSDFANGLLKTKTGFVTGVKNPTNSKKVEGMVDLYGDETYKLTKDEKKELNNRLRRKLIKALS